ncbi:hypothetical protein FACS1894216_01000 [Synergistales bacterium]|nr:hypothetical protein FACS1894216_01000 [Synergistales bacterium]
MRNDDILICEEILRDYYEIRQSLTIRKLELMSCAPIDAVRVDGGEGVPEAQRFIEDRVYSDLSHVCETIHGALQRLPKELHKIIILIYVMKYPYDQVGIKMSYSTKTIRNRCLQAIYKMHGELLRLFPRVRAWREQEDECKRRIAES